MTDVSLGLRHFDLHLYPGVPPFALDLTRRGGEAQSFLVRSAAQPAVIERAPVAQGLLRTNRAWGNDVDGAIGRWEHGEARVFIAGQQAGLGGGPLYTLTKIASLIRLRERCRSGGEDAVAMFWMATEDHDYLEAANLLVATHRLQVRVRPPERPDPRHIVGTLPLPESARRELLELFPDLSGAWLEPGVSFGDSFARLLAIALRGHQIILVDSLLPELRSVGGPLFEAIVDRWEEAERSVDIRSSALEEAGYPAQIVSDEGHALLWMITAEGLRLPIRRRGVDYTVGEEPKTREELRELVRTAPERISTGALTRPLLQDFVFASHTFVGGPVEVSYYAQCAALHELLGVRLPNVVLRGHALVCPARIVEKLERHGFPLPELFEDPDVVLARHSSDEIDGWTTSIADAAKDLDAQVAAITDRVEGSPPQLLHTVSRSMSRISYHLDRMQQRGARALARRNSDRTAAYERARAVLAPGGTPQDRVAGWLPWFAMFGDSLLTGLLECVEPGSMRVTVVALGARAEEGAGDH